MKICDKCKEETEELRQINMSCLYDMNELKVPFRKIGRDYTLIICKDCRADWMSMIKVWWGMPPYKNINKPGTGIFIKELGAIVEISEEKWHELNPGKEPVRFIDDEHREVEIKNGKVEKLK